MMCSLKTGKCVHLSVQIANITSVVGVATAIFNFNSDSQYCYVSYCRLR